MLLMDIALYTIMGPIEVLVLDPCPCDQPIILTVADMRAIHGT